MTKSPSVPSLEPPAVHSSPDSNDECVGNPSGPDIDLVVRKLGEEIYAEVGPHHAEAPFHDSKEPQPLRLRRSPPPTSNGDGYQQPEVELQSQIGRAHV